MGDIVISLGGWSSRGSIPRHPIGGTKMEKNYYRMCPMCRRWLNDNEVCVCETHYPGREYELSRRMVNPDKYALNWPPFTGSFPTSKIWSLGVSHRANCGDGESFFISHAFFCWVGVGYPYEPVHLRKEFQFFEDAKEWLDRFYVRWNQLHGISK